MPIAIATAGKFAGPPTKEAAADYGGGSTSSPSPPKSKQHKFPKLKITSIDRKEEDDIELHILSVEEYNYD